jgi:hypothetical protein
MTGPKITDRGPPLGPKPSRARPVRNKVVTHHWSRQQIEVLRDLWGRIRAKAIGKLIGKTRCAVIGKAYRIGLPTINEETLGEHISAGLNAYYYGPEQAR